MHISSVQGEQVLAGAWTPEGSVGLVRSCQAGDKAAWTRLFSLFSGRVWRWLVLQGMTPADAEDGAQETLVIAVRRIDTCNGDEVLVSWLYQIARRVAANKRRSAWWRYVVGGRTVTEPAFEHHLEHSGAMELTVRRVLAQLSRPQAEVLTLIEVEGFTRSEVAAMLGLSEGTVASRLRLARESFARHWAKGESP